MASGDTLNIAARLEQAAGPGEILIGEQTHRLTREAARVEPLGPLALKGKSRPVLAYRVVSITEHPAGHPRRLRAELVGRQGELATLAAIYDRCCETRSVHVAALIAEPGGGKSRLAREFVGALAPGASVLHVRCPSYGEGITYWPLGQAIRQAAAIGDEAAGGARIDALLAGQPDASAAGEFLAVAAGVSAAPATPEEIAWASRTLLQWPPRVLSSSSSTTCSGRSRRCCACWTRSRQSKRRCCCSAWLARNCSSSRPGAMAVQLVSNSRSAG